MKPKEYFITRCIVDPTTGCWNWTLSTYGNGYGQARHQGTGYLAHRLAYETWYGPIPDGLLVRHTCDNKLCLNPEHLLLGTHEDNSADKLARNRNTRDHFKLTEEQVRAIKTMYPQESQSQIADKFGVTRMAIASIIHGRTWRHV
jgi:hypothetical protein